MLNELSESNRSLREEMDRLTERLAAQEEEARRVEADIVSPARQRTNELTARVEQLSTENTALKTESAMLVPIILLIV
jgi:chromosome segregation ATPase